MNDYKQIEQQKISSNQVNCVTSTKCTSSKRHFTFIISIVSDKIETTQFRLNFGVWILFFVVYFVILITEI